MGSSYDASGHMVHQITKVLVGYVMLNVRYKERYVATPPRLPNVPSKLRDRLAVKPGAGGANMLLHMVHPGQHPT